MKSRTRAFSLNLLLVAVLLVATPAIVPAPAAQVTGYTVTNKNDSGPGSLREAITFANGDGGVYTDITFYLSGCPCTITLLSALPEVTESLVITGPGADQLTISGNNAWRVFKVHHSASLTLEKLTVANGTDDTGLKQGAGIYSEGPLTITDCVFSGNRATSGTLDDHHGGAIRFVDGDGTLTITGSTFANNEAHSLTASGGAISAWGTVEISNSTFYGNKTSPTNSWGYGSVIYFQGVTLTMTHCTVHNNTSYSNQPNDQPAGAVHVWAGTATLKNTIIANNPGGNCSTHASGSQGGTIVDGGGNLQYGDTTCGATIPTGDPKLKPLAYNGGSTKTMALPMDSPAVDACACTTVTDDQRGNPRPFDWLSVDDESGPCDIGAYEAGVRTYLPVVLKCVQYLLRTSRRY